MATQAAGDRLIPLSGAQNASGLPQAATSQRRPRKLSPEAGRGIEILGHAIDYLTDEFALDCVVGEVWSEPGPGSELHPRLAAIELLKMLNREIYFSCPEIPTLAERLRFRVVRSWLSLR